MGTIQQSLFPHLEECLPSPLTDQDKRLIKILELIQIEKHTTKTNLTTSRIVQGDKAGFVCVLLQLANRSTLNNYLDF